MSGAENALERFLLRWSRRKQIDQKRPRGESEPPESANPETGSPIAAGARGEPDLPVFDSATLPPIDSITATSDIRAFLAPGVPDELSRAALRRAWVTDPTIRDFVGLAENQWDFTKPDAVPGFGSLESTQELRRMLARLVGDRTEQSPADEQATADASEKLLAQVAPPVVDAPSAPREPSGPPMLLPSNNNDAAAHIECGDPTTSSERSHRKHGGALPK